jgi:hypothetical protein
MHERALLTYPTWERYNVLARAIGQLPVRERRVVFAHARAEGASPDLLFPAHGFTLGEFAVWHVIGRGGGAAEGEAAVAGARPEKTF